MAVCDVQVMSAVQATKSFTARDWCVIREYDYYLPVNTFQELGSGGHRRFVSTVAASLVDVDATLFARCHTLWY